MKKFNADRREMLRNMKRVSKGESISESYRHYNAAKFVIELVQNELQKGKTVKSLMWSVSEIFSTFQQNENTKSNKMHRARMDLVNALEDKENVRILKAMDQRNKEVKEERKEQQGIEVHCKHCNSLYTTTRKKLGEKKFKRRLKSKHSWEGR